MLKHSTGTVHHAFTHRGVRAGHVVHVAMSGSFPSPHSEHVSADDPIGSPGVLGLALDDRDAGALVSFSFVELDDGLEIDNPAWSFRPGSVFLGLDGVLTQEEVETGSSERIGVAAGPHRLTVDRHSLVRSGYPGEIPSAAAPRHPLF